MVFKLLTSLHVVYMVPPVQTATRTVETATVKPWVKSFRRFEFLHMCHIGISLKYMTYISQCELGYKAPQHQP